MPKTDDSDSPSERGSDVEYEAYLASPQWKKLRADRLRQAKFRCERCGNIKSADQLHVHHLTYERLGRELMSDLQVLCLGCHWKADQERKASGGTARPEGYDHSPLRAGFDGWMRNGGHEDWYDYYDYTLMRHAQTFLESIGLDGDSPALIEAACGVERMRRSRVQRLLDLADNVFPGFVSPNFGPGPEDSLARLVGMREIAEAWDKPMLDRDLDDVIRTAQFYGIPYRRLRIELNGPHEGQWRPIEEFDGTRLRRIDDRP